MRFQQLSEQIYHRPWLITYSGHASVEQLFKTKLAEGFQFKADEVIADNPYVNNRDASCLDSNGVGHIHIKGVVGQGLSKIEKSCGNTDTRDVANELAALISQGAKGILIRVDSPGGTVQGIPELAAAIADVALTLPVFVFTDSQACSAAYWLIAGASRIIATESAHIGSIGVYLPWIDKAALWEKEGVKAEPIINDGGTFKAIGFGPSLSDVHRAELQAKVDRIFGLFKSFVTGSRALAAGVMVPDSSCQGQVFLGIDAEAAGLVDEISTFEDCYAQLLQAIATPDTDSDSDLDDSVTFELPNNS